MTTLDTTQWYRLTDILGRNPIWFKNTKLGHNELLRMYARYSLTSEEDSLRAGLLKFLEIPTLS